MRKDHWNQERNITASTITPLDGYLDGFFQEVYLEAESIPIFSKLVKNVSGDALDHYVSQLKKEVKGLIPAAGRARSGLAWFQAGSSGRSR